MCSSTIARRSSALSAASPSASPWSRNRNRISPPWSLGVRRTEAPRVDRTMLERPVSVHVHDPLLGDLLSAPLEEVLDEARRLRPGTLVTYSPKVFIPLTKL